MKLPDSITELKTWPNGSLVVFLERLKNAVSTYQEDDMIEEVIDRLKRLEEHHHLDEALIVQRTDEIRWHEKENARLRAALHEIAYLQSAWPRWEYQDLYESSRGMANEALANNRSLPAAQNPPL